MIINSSSNTSNYCIPKPVSVNKVKKIDQQSTQTGYGSSCVTAFFKWVVNKPQCFIASALWLSSLGTGAVSMTLPGTLASRSVRSLGGETEIPFANATTVYYPGVTIGTQGTFPDMTISCDESRFAIPGETTTPWLEAAVPELSEARKPFVEDQFDVEIDGEIFDITECKIYKHGLHITLPIGIPIDEIEIEIDKILETTPVSESVSCKFTKKSIGNTTRKMP